MFSFSNSDKGHTLRQITVGIVQLFSQGVIEASLELDMGAGFVDVSDAFSMAGWASVGTGMPHLVRSHGEWVWLSRCWSVWDSKVRGTEKQAEEAVSKGRARLGASVNAVAGDVCFRAHPWYSNKWCRWACLYHHAELILKRWPVL